jgi:hypothetical protein
MGIRRFALPLNKKIRVSKFTLISWLFSLLFIYYYYFKKRIILVLGIFNFNRTSYFLS